MSVSTLKASLAAANKAIAVLHDTDKQLKGAHADALRERKRLMNAIEPVENVVANMVALVDGIAAQHRKDIGRAHVAEMSGALRSTTSGNVVVKRPELRDMYSPLSLKDLAALAPQIVKESLEAIIRSQPEGDGLPFTERPAALAVLDARIAEIEEQHCELVDVAASSGVKLTYLAPVAERRRIAAIQRQQESTSEENTLSLGAHVIN